MDAIRGRSEDIRFMLQNYDQETHLRTTKRIFIIGPNHIEKVKGILRESGINPNNIITDKQEAKERGYDLLFINNISGNLYAPNNDQSEDQEKEMLKTINDEQRKVCFFYYCESNIHFPVQKIQDYEVKKRFNFATNPSQVYGNIINLLKIQDRNQ